MMIRGTLASVILFVFATGIFAEIALTGTVKKTGATEGLAGVTVSLAKKPDLTAATGADGTFKLTDGTPAVTPQQRPSTSLDFSFDGSVIVFRAPNSFTSGTVELFTANGKSVFSKNISQMPTNSVSLPLRDIGAGIYLLRVTVDEKTFTQAFARVGNDLVLQNTVNTDADAAFSLSTQAAAAIVDTIVASKAGFETKKVPISNYVQKDMVITLDSVSGGGKCMRESLKAIVDKYIEAQTAGDPTKMPLANGVKVSVNSKDTSLEKSILKQAMKIDFNLSIYDVDSCRTFTEVIVAKTTPQYVIGTRLRVKDNKITEVEMIVTKKGDWLFNAADYLKYAKQQNWYILPDKERSTREKLVDAGNQYLDMFNGDFDGLPWGAPCYRIEGGAITLKSDTTADDCKVKAGELAGGKFLIGGRDFIVDVELGSVDVFCAFCDLDSHLLRLVNGHYRYVHTLTVNCPPLK